MKVLLRHVNTGLYYRDSSEWTENPDAASDFKASANALQLVSEMRLEGVEIVLWFDDPRYNLILPLH
ncbi:MAG TPA: hypothetical protein VHH88_12995, partial [Verrucomicrobiae bacterium]|nr:hypothetical protein [Verrucomicrobiae bacterium]